MTVLIKCLNENAKDSLRVILAMHGPVCFNATLLTENCTKIRKHNIVAVTADLGLEALNLVAKELDIPLETLGLKITSISI